MEHNYKANMRVTWDCTTGLFLTDYIACETTAPWRYRFGLSAPEGYGTCYEDGHVSPRVLVAAFTSDSHSMRPAVNVHQISHPILLGCLLLTPFVRQIGLTPSILKLKRSC